MRASVRIVAAAPLLVAAAWALALPPALHAGAPVAGAVATLEGSEQEADSVVGASGMTPEELDAETARIADQLRCPVCRSQSVRESSADLSREMQGEILRRLAAGDSPEEVRAHFVASYGEWILLQPRAEGLNLLVYVLPGVALLLGGLVVWRLLPAWSAHPADAGHEAGSSRDARDGDTFEEDLDPEEEERLRAALRGEAGKRGG